jgi:pyrroloquinoline quinone biosynthesis protein D
VTIAGATVVRFAPGVRLREDTARGGRWIVLAPERMFVPDETALEVLRLLDGMRDVDAVIDDLAARYATPREAIAQDVSAMLQDLADKGVVMVSA